MKIRKIFLCLIALVLACGMAISCNKTSETEEQQEEKFEATEITSILNKANNESVNLEGVVYGVTKNGFFVSDSTKGHIFVNMTDTWDKSVKAGDQVQVTAQYSIVNGFPQIKNVTKLTNVSSGNKTLAVTKSSVADVQKMDATKANAGTYVELVGSISVDTTSDYLITDDEGNSLYFDSKSDTDTLASFNGQRVTIDCVVYKYSLVNEAWSLSFAGTTSEITANPITFEEVLAKAKKHIESVLATDVYGAITLPSHHNLISSLTYTWSVDTNANISIENNVATIITDKEDHNVTLHCLISNGKESQNVDYPVVLKGIVERTVSGFYANLPTVDNSEVIVRGIVVAKTRNQSLTLRSLIIMDPETTETISIDYGVTEGFLTVDDETFANAKQGDEIVATGHYRTGATDRATILNLTSVETKSTGNAWSHDYENAYVLEDADDYSYLADNIESYTNKLVKFVNPYIQYSTSTAPSIKNWLKLGYDADHVSSGQGTSAQVKRNFAFLLGCVDENYGDTSWRTSLDIPYSTETAEQFGLVIYAYALYLSDSYVAFIVPDQDSFIIPDYRVIEKDLFAEIPATAEEGKLTLATTHEKATGNIVWTSTDTSVIDTDGTIKSVTKDTTVTLTATYYVGTEKYEISKEVTVLYSEPKTVTEALSGTEGQTVKVKGVVIAYTSDANSVESRKGFVLMDNTNGNCIIIDGIGALYGTEYPNYQDKNGTAIAIGQEVVVKGTLSLTEAAISTGPVQSGRIHVDVSTGGEVEIVTEKVTLNITPAYTVENETQLAALFNDGVPFGKIIKLVGTAETPIYIGGSANSTPCKYKIFMANASDNAGTKINGYTIALDSATQAANSMENWMTSYYGIPAAFVAPKAGSPAYAMTGTMYIVISHNTSTYYQAAIVDFENWTILPSADSLDTNIFRNTPTSVETGDIDLKLPTSIGCIGNITYTSSDAAIDLATNKATGGESEKEVTITATYKYNGEDHNAEFVIKVAASKIEYKTVSEVVALAEEADVYVEGVVIGFGKDGTNTKVARYGVIIADPATGKTVLVNGFDDITYPTFKDSADATIAIGDKVQVKGSYQINKDATGATSVYSNAVKVAKITVTENNVALDYSKMTGIKTVTTNAELEALLGSTNYYDAIIKITGSAANLVYGRRPTKDAFSEKTNMVFHMNSAATDAAGCKYNSKNLVINVSTATYLGSTWYNTFGGSSFQNSAVKNPLTGDMYIVITHTTGSYYQAAVVNYTGWTLAAYSAN